jgi:predicted dehydrogenase
MGAGRMAQGFDEPGHERVLSLAHGVKKSPQLQLAGFYDLHPERAEAAERKWNCPPSPRDREAWLDAGWDIVLIATPTDCHIPDFEAALKRKPKAVMVEKPLAHSLSDAERVLSIARDQATPVVVDYPRRWHSGVREVGHKLAANELGRIRRIHGLCSGGVRHNGVHLLDLVAAWCPSIERVELIAKHGDTAWLNLITKDGPVDFVLSAATQENCYVWELRIETDRARIEFCDAPEVLRLSSPGPHPNYPTHQALVAGQTWSMEDEPLLVHMLAHLASMIGNEEAARKQTGMEIERERLFDAVLKHF